MMDTAKNILQRGRWWLSSLLGKDIYHRSQVRCPMVFVGGRTGTGYGGWTVCADRLSAQSTVYSFGIGDEISFDLDLIQRYGVRVYAFDPTPASHRWLATQTYPASFVPHEIGIANFDGTATFHAPSNPSWISHSMIPTGGTQSDKVEGPVRRLSTLMEMLGHHRIDLLKMDIEGAEYDVIEDIVASSLNVEQILVEFHHRFESIAPERTAAAIQTLNDAGYRIAHASARGEEYTFIRFG